ncbi:MAG: mechanosensitive ion channel family protein [Flavobacteriales bacterium]
MKEFLSSWIRKWVTEGLGLSPELAVYFRLLILLLILLILCWLVWYISRRFIVTLIRRIVKRTDTDWDDIILERRVFHDLAHVPPLILIQVYTRYVMKDFGDWVPLVERITEILIVLVLMKVVLRVLNSVHDILIKQDGLKDKPVHSFIQVGKILVVTFFGIIVLSLLLSRSPLYFLSAMGAASAVIIFIFKDSILALVASVQLMANDLLRVGDWVSVPKYDADGYVIRINLSTVLVQNWDNTYSSIPPYVFIADSFINYRGMLESGGRRIMQSLNIKANSVSFCDEERVEDLKRYDLLREGLEDRKSDRDSQMTDLELFRTYAEAFVRQHPGINKEMLCLVRQLEAGSHGIPLQVYAFTTDKSLAVHSRVISDIFSHLTAMAPYFGLEVFESPSGVDLRERLKAAGKQNEGNG